MTLLLLLLLLLLLWARLLGPAAHVHSQKLAKPTMNRNWRLRRRLTRCAAATTVAAAVAVADAF